MMAQVWAAPAVMAAHAEAPSGSGALAVGAATAFAIVVARCPYELSPQHRMALAEVRPQVKYAPGANEVNVALPVTLTGDERLVPVPSPSCPALFLPQHQAAPSMSMAQVWLPPA